MKKLCNKFRSVSGASMIVALMFMLVCIFVGGSVLVAATVNGSRAADNYKLQQNILSQRSICSVFSRVITKTTVDSEGNAKNELDISLPYETDDTGKKAAINQYSDTNDTLKFVIREAAKEAINSGESKNIGFTVTDTDNNPVYCYAKCDPKNYTVYIRFKDSANELIEDKGTANDISQVQLRLLGQDINNTIRWYSVKIIKAE